MFDAAAEAGAVEYIVAEGERALFAPDEVRSDDQRLGNSPGLLLDLLEDGDSEPLAISEQALEERAVFGRGDDQDCLLYTSDAADE